jgi:XisI protein.
LLQSGWDTDDYLHGAIVYIRLIDGKIWIQYDGTEKGVTTELLEAGARKSIFGIPASQ